MKKSNNIVVFAAFLAILPLFSGCASAPPAVVQPAIQSDNSLSAAPATGEKDAEIEKLRASVTEELKKSVREEVKSEVRDEFAREMGKVEMSATAPEWAKRVRFGGDIRQRQDNDRSDKIRNDYAPPANLVKTAHEATPDGGYAAVPGHMNEGMNGRGPADNSIAALVDLLKKKNVINSDEAARLTQQYAAGAAAPVSDSVSALVALLQTKNVLSATEAAGLAGQSAVPAARGAGAAVASKAEDKERTEKITADVTQKVMKGLQDQVQTEVQAALPVEMNKKKEDFLSFLPEWLRSVRWGGDIRLRYEADRFGKDNYPNPNNISALATNLTSGANNAQPVDYNTNTDRYKYRVRFGIDAMVDNRMDAIVNLSTGNTNTPVSTNSILGNSFNKDNVLFDLAYVKWRPADFLTLYGGRMPNPFFTTDLVWSRDVNFEGLALNAHVPVTESWTPFVTAGIFPLQQPMGAFNINIQRQKWLAAGQVGAERQSRKVIGLKLGASYYEFTNYRGIPNSVNNAQGNHANDWTAPQFIQKGNYLINISDGSADSQTYLFGLASKFREGELTGLIDVGLWDPYHVVFLGDFVKNFGYSQARLNDFTARGLFLPGTKFPKDAVGYQVGMSVGYPVVEKLAQWKTYVYYKRLDADAVVDAFTDSDFHLGGTNAKGWVLGADLGLHKNTWLTLRWLTTDEIVSPPLAIDVFQADFNVKF